MKISSLLLSLLVIVSTACSSGPSPVAEACSLVERARMDSASRLSSSPSRESIEVIQRSMDAAHFAVSDLSYRQRRRLVADCDAVTGYTKGAYREMTYPAVASDLQAGEASIREALVALAAFEAAEKQFEAAEKRLVVEIEATCKALGDAKNTEVEGAESRLRDLNRAVKMLRERWSTEQLERFVDYCEVEVDQDWEADISALTPVAQTEREREDARERERRDIARRIGCDNISPRSVAHCTNLRAQRVVRAVLGDRWPLTIDAGTVICSRQGTRQIATFLDDVNREYALNGTADSMGWPSIRPIWADDDRPGFRGQGIKKSISPLISAAVSLC
jgi:hypothetical protein